MIEQRPEGDQFSLPTTEYLAEQLRMIRRWRDVSLDDVCRDTGISESTLSRLERNVTVNLDIDHRVELNRWLKANTVAVEPGGLQGAIKAIEADQNLSFVDCVTLKEFLNETYRLVIDRENLIRRIDGCPT